jgi:tRNA (mo5U34)-methyltransferase
VHRDFLPELAAAVTGLIEPTAREALGPGKTALDIACNEGWFAHRLLEWGAERVVGIDSREFNVRRARMIRDHFELPAERLDLRTADLVELDPDRDGRFDIVAFLGILYHLEDPIGALRLVRSLTRSLCVIQSQVMRIDGPAELSYATGERHSVAPAFALYREPEAEAQISPLAAMPGVASLVPNSAAVAEAALAAGFAHAEVLEPPAREGLWRDWVVVLARC